MVRSSGVSAHTVWERRCIASAFTTMIYPSVATLLRMCMSSYVQVDLDIHLHQLDWVQVAQLSAISHRTPALVKPAMSLILGKADQRARIAANIALGMVQLQCFVLVACPAAANCSQ